MPSFTLLPQLTRLSFIFPFSSISSDVSNLFHPLIHFLLWPHLFFRYLFLSLNPPSILCSSTPLHPNVPLSCFLLSSSSYYSNLTLSQLILSVHHSFTIYLVFSRYDPLLYILNICLVLLDGNLRTILLLGKTKNKNLIGKEMLFTQTGICWLQYKLIMLAAGACDMGHTKNLRTSNTFFVITTLEYAHVFFTL